MSPHGTPGSGAFTLRKALSLGRKCLSPDHSTIVASLIILGIGLVDESRWEEAEKMTGEAVEIARRVFAGDHPTRIGCLELFKKSMEQ